MSAIAAAQASIAELFSNLAIEGVAIPADEWAWEEENSLWSIVIGFPDASEAEARADASDIAIQLEIQLVGFKNPSDPKSVIVCWVAIPPGRMYEDWQDSTDLLSLLNAWNREPGVKFRVDGTGSNTSLVIESDIAYEHLVPTTSPQTSLLQNALDRSFNALVAYFDQIEDAIS